MADEVLLDCEEGRRLGCRTLCCRLVVRLMPGEGEPGGHDHPLKRCVDKDPQDGLCIYLSRQTGRCTRWTERPAACRGYDCNHDVLLQVVVQDGVQSVVEAAKLATIRAYPTKVSVPYIDPSDDG